MKTKLKFAFEKETKNTYRYFECDKKGVSKPYAKQVMGTLYIRKDHFGDKSPPETIEVTIKG